MDVTVAVATFGDASWMDLARDRAIPSAGSQAPVVYEHRGTLAEARNACLEHVTSEFVVFLDADDQLAPGYIEAMATGTADLRAPQVQYLGPGITRPPYFPRVWSHQHACEAECLREGNWIVIGAAVRTELLRRAGGWQDETVYEDWSAWLRCWLAGGTIERIPGAVYQAHVRPDSRNRAPSHAEKEHWHRVIYESCFGKAAA